jgi:hypothetical protein
MASHPGLICLGCAHAQPNKSVVPTLRRMLASHERSLVAARGHGEPAGQIPAREMEGVRIKGALQRAEELTDDVAAAIERALLSRLTVGCERQRIYTADECRESSCEAPQSRMRPGSILAKVISRSLWLAGRF